jgi:hypothetical protein
MPLPLLATKLVGMTGYGPASFHDLLSDDDPLTEGSSVGDVSSLGCLALRECAMVDVQGPQLVPVETGDTQTPPHLCEQALANAQAHGKDLRQRQSTSSRPHRWTPNTTPSLLLLTWRAACACQVQQC